jgi:hypothetical protein
MIICGDCLEVMRGMDANSIDAIVTDPPYGLSFMGKDWDHGIPGVPFWAEVIRVAKPGAHLLAFGGTRTFHRLACAIEDAGWEIRDCLGFLYGQGFPKSHNFGCKCHDEKTKHDLRPMRESDLSETVSTESAEGEVLLSGLSQSGLSAEGREQLPASEIWPRESSVEGRSDLFPQARQLQADKVCSVSSGVPVDGPQGRVCDGASPDNGDGNGKAAPAKRGRPSQKPRPAGQSARKPGTIPEQSGAQDSGVVCPKCGGLLDWRGWGTALKPAWEPIIMARKPLDGTVAANVLKWGTGAINVDGCRVGTEQTTTVRNGDSGGNGAYGRDERVFTRINPPGRWPANLLHDGSDEVLELFPQTTTWSGKRTKPGTGYVFNGHGDKPVGHNGRDGDSGSAARFFYCAKASRKEREMGCEGMPVEPWVQWQTANGTSGKPSSLSEGRHTAYANRHPTVKPLALMRYLCRLVTPPNGTILDPFMGSGTTLIAAEQEGFQAIGIDVSEEYCEIARKRTHNG